MVKPSLEQMHPLQVTAKVPDPFPVPMLKEDVEKSQVRKNCAGDRKYIVHVLATILLTHVQKPSMRQCEVVAKALVRKFPFLKEYVSIAILFSYNYILLLYACIV